MKLRPPRLDPVPELPEVEALALDLGNRLAGRAIATVHIAAFSALKTFDPPLRAVEGAEVRHVTRHGKFLDITVGAPDQPLRQACLR